MKLSEEPGNTPVSRFQLQEDGDNGVKKALEKVCPAFPYGLTPSIESICGSTYVSAQTLAQQVAYSLSDRLFSFSPETFALDTAAKSWAATGKKNGFGAATVLNSMETRLGAGSTLLGYIFSKDNKSELPHSIVASTNTLTYMQTSLNQLSLLYSIASPVVAHVAAIDYTVNSSQLVTDYVSAITVARDTGLGLIGSFSTHETQHMALFATLVASVLPTIHIYDGVKAGRESTRVADVLDRDRLRSLFETISKEQKEVARKADTTTRMSHILKSLNAELGTAYSFFEYEGHENPEAVLVVFGSVESSLATQVASHLSMAGERVGIITVRVYNPFSEAHFVEALPKYVKRVVVLGQVADELAVSDPNVQSSLFTDVFSAIIMCDTWVLPPPVHEIKYPRQHTWTPSQFSLIFSHIAQRDRVVEALSLDALSVEASLDLFRGSQYVFWDIDNSTTASSPAILAKALSADSKSNVSFFSTYDNGPQAGALHSAIRISKRLIESPYHVQNADVCVVTDSRLLSSYDVVANVKQGGSVLVKCNLKDDELQKLPATFRHSLVTKGAELHLLNPTLEGEGFEEFEEFEAALVQLAFLGLANLASTQSLLHMLETSNPIIVHKASEYLAKALRKVDVPKAWAEDMEAEAVTLPVAPKLTGFTLNEAKIEEEPASLLQSWQTIAKSLSFKEAYGVKKALRPDLTVKNFVVKVRANRRLTPDYYDRNVFHIEFDTTGTGLKYDIGEALGIHAHNDQQEVADFIKFYGLNSEEIVKVPSREDPDILEARTVFQALLQNVDIFGRPPKKFYEALAEFATNPEEKKALLTLSSLEGATEFKRRAEVDTVTYADIFLEFPSAHPEFHDLIKIVSPLKRREYSIASAQVVNPTSVHLLIVQVNWVDTKGRDRFGQATRYLSNLPIGAEVTVSVKPSVMKLPKHPTQPLIMAGLGTGLAPFRAFLQYRAWQKSQGVEVGDILLYMGSRHQREEYLYGEEWEAYMAAGLLTHLGCAFSRDQKEKIYIQDRMRQSMEQIVEAYMRKDGVFYLCGPTWPVPDVSAVLQEAIMRDAALRGMKVDSRKKLEEFKEQERYILEVY